MTRSIRSERLCDLLLTTKDGDWGTDGSGRGLVAYRIIRGADFPQARTSDLQDVPIRYIDSESARRRTLEAHDILIETAGGSRDRPTGRTLRVTPSMLSSSDLPLTCASFCRFLRVDPTKAHPDYVFWYLQYLYRTGAMWEHQVQHTGVARFQYTQFAGSTAVPLPQLPVQERIAHILGRLDDKIELNRKMNETLEQMARALFKSWFVDFEPFRDKGMIDSPLGKIPKGWRVGRVDDDFDLTMGQSPPGETYNERGDGIPFYQGRTDFGFRFPTVRVFCNAPTRKAKAGDTLVSVRAPVGSVNVASGECSVGRGVAAVRHNSGSRSYTYYFMRFLEPEFARFEAEGTVFGSINKDDFHALERVAPPPAMIEAFERTLFPVDQRIENNETESRTLAALRDALLPKLMSGEIQTKEVK